MHDDPSNTSMEDRLKAEEAEEESGPGTRATFTNVGGWLVRGLLLSPLCEGRSWDLATVREFPKFAGWPQLDWGVLGHDSYLLPTHHSNYSDFIYKSICQGASGVFAVLRINLRVLWLSYISKPNLFSRTSQGHPSEYTPRHTTSTSIYLPPHLLHDAEDPASTHPGLSVVGPPAPLPAVDKAFTCSLVLATAHACYFQTTPNLRDGSKGELVHKCLEQFYFDLL